MSLKEIGNRLKNATTTNNNNSQLSIVKNCYYKTYTFTFTPDFSDKQTDTYVLGYFQICSVTFNRLHTLNLKTSGGKYIALNCANEKYAKLTKDSTPKSQRYLTSRSTKIKLKKGESVYISRYFEKNAEAEAVNFELNIK